MPPAFGEITPAFAGCHGHLPNATGFRRMPPDAAEEA
jgi:hypothetical protein